MTDRSTRPHTDRLATAAQGRVVSFTGSRDLDPLQHEAILEDLQALSGATGFITGACIGVDHFVGETLFEIFPDHQHTVIVPADRSRVAAWWRNYIGYNNLHVHEMPSGTTYADRNRYLVNDSHFMIGYPAHDEKHFGSNRSGTWQTLRMARRQHVRHPIVHVLDNVWDWS